MAYRQLLATINLDKKFVDLINVIRTPQLEIVFNKDFVAITFSVC